MNVRQSSVAACVLFLLLCAACGDENPFPTAFSVTVDARNQDGSVTCPPDPDCSFTLGEPITFTVTVTNTSASPQKIAFLTSQRFDVLVAFTGPSKQKCDPAEPDAEPVWRWSVDQQFFHVTAVVSFAPGETVSFSDVWDQKDNLHLILDCHNHKAGTLVGPSSPPQIFYLVTGIITGDLANPASQPLEFNLR